ncbi:MAG TPA: hypothetical protein VHW68_03645 [Actinomycetota bacterium]|jgi:hypothetical protein|nr:hypothetical protein [Actinomycetota bacterium]
MQTDQERRCPSCGADNKQGVSFCWRCYAPFGEATAAFATAAAATRTGGATATRTGPAMPAAPRAGAPTAQPTRTRSRGGRIGRILVGVVIALVVGGVVQHVLNPTYHVPDSIASEPRVHNAVSDKFEQTMAQTAQQDDIPLEAAVYGTDSSPDLFFVLANGRAEENADQLFTEFLSGAESAGIKVDQSATITGSHDGAEYRCVPISAQGIEAAACVWREDHSVGMTLDASPDGDITSAVVAAYDATHS